MEGWVLLLSALSHTSGKEVISLMGLQWPRAAGIVNNSMEEMDTTAKISSSWRCFWPRRLVLLHWLILTFKSMKREARSPPNIPTKEKAINSS